jgi:hypothetical protein
MDNLPDWVVSIIAVAVGLSPGLAILSVRRIARLLHRALWSRPKEHFRPDVRRCGKDRLRFQFRQGDVAFRAHPRTPADIALILTRFNAVPVASGMVCSQALRTESGTRGRSSTLK